MPQSQDEKFGIEFVDPDELIKFIEEGQEDQDLENTPDDSIQADQTSSDLTYADKILEEATEYVVKKQEDTRGKLAVLYTTFTFIVFILGIFICVLDGIIRQVSIIDNLTSVLPLLSGIFLGTLGFVIGYYFRKDNE